MWMHRSDVIDDPLARLAAPAGIRGVTTC